jgi:HSP20 family protein
MFFIQNLINLSSRIFKQIIPKRRFTMSNLTRWEPIREMVTLREAMDRLFDDPFTRPFNLTGGSFSGSFVPAIDLYQTADDVVVQAALPGFGANDVQITVTNDVLTLRGESRWQDGNGNGDKNFTYHLREHRFGSFERSIALPVPVQSDKAKAEFQNGILTITLPKAEAVRPKTISIKTK